MKNKIILIIALVCMVVPFMVLGYTASAQVVDVPNYSSPSLPVQLNFGYTSYYYDLSSSSSVFAWNGAPYFSRNFNLDSSAVFSPFYLPWGDSTMNWTFLPGDSDSDYGVFDFVLDTGLDISSGGKIQFTVPDDGLVHTFVALVVFTANDQTSLNSITSSFQSQYLLDYTRPSDVNAMTAYLNDIGDSDQRITLAPRSDLDLNYSLSYASPDFPASIDTFRAFTSRNLFVTYSSSVSPGLHTFSCLNSASGTVLAVFDMALYSDSYQQGFNEGYSNGFNDGLVRGEQNSYDEGVQAGMQQANSTVNKNSASYYQGLSDGRADANEYTFLGLIGAILDAPINALFGYTSGDGVFHPGLFSIEILGMNMSAFILSIFTLGLIIAILRLCLGGK